MKIIITGATGMVGQGVLLECLETPSVSEVLIIGIKNYEPTHPKLKKILLKDFSEIKNHSEILKHFLTLSAF